MIKKRVFKTKSFTKWMKKCNIHDQDLLAAIIEMDLGLIDADLGGKVYIMIVEDLGKQLMYIKNVLGCLASEKDLAPE